MEEMGVMASDDFNICYLSPVTMDIKLFNSV